MIIDTHTHFYDPSRPQGVPWPPEDDDLLYRTVLPESFKELAEPLGISGTVVVEASAWLEDNQWILDLAEDEPFLLGLVGHVDPCREAFKAEIDRFAGHPLFVGIRCGEQYFQDVEQGGFLADVEHLVEKDLELDVLIRKPHFGGLVELARRLPELRIVIDHVAHVPIDGNPPDPEWVEGIQRAGECPQVYMKVSALMEMGQVRPAPEDMGFYAPTLDAIWEAFGEDRVIFGSNWPVCEKAGAYEAVLRIVEEYFSGKGEQAREKYFWKNALSAYRLQRLPG